ncbi:MAG TPA: hypothetical protein HA282_01130 [Nanoarchaeota archaeon]|nr:hypothetical protein [Candidatus Pacearchaeota archaeon]HIH17955.1 hypothetical protein [Nanoarchaeota archaeon]HIH33823.1 hypothetical protein [Nanoarchaeota archaeon]HIH50765.1 hypothetical protein [Nanoarchaeota archaeon]HIH65802.1 hypothetical protein [Nanoarchaeota archaeon]
MAREYSKLAALALGSAALMNLYGCNQNPRVERMQNQQGSFKITHSVERDNINFKNEYANDPNKVMWIYCLSDMGNIVLTSPVVGKVTSSNKRLEPKTLSDESSIEFTIEGDRLNTDEVMGADGTYGESDQYVYWKTPEKQYFQWSGSYILSSAPLKLERPILNVRDIDYTELQRGRIAEQALKEGKKVKNNLEILTK